MNHAEVGIIKNEISIKEAWNIGINDVAMIALTENDQPIVPSNITNPVYLETIREISMLKKYGQQQFNINFTSPLAL